MDAEYPGRFTYYQLQELVGMVGKKQNWASRGYFTDQTEAEGVRDTENDKNGSFYRVVRVKKTVTALLKAEKNA